MKLGSRVRDLKQDDDEATALVVDIYDSRADS